MRVDSGSSGEFVDPEAVFGPSPAYVTLGAAADLVGTTRQGLHKRVQRGSLPAALVRLRGCGLVLRVVRKSDLLALWHELRGSGKDGDGASNVSD